MSLLPSSLQCTDELPLTLGKKVEPKVNDCPKMAKTSHPDIVSVDGKMRTFLKDPNKVYGPRRPVPVTQGGPLTVSQQESRFHRQGTEADKAVTIRIDSNHKVSGLADLQQISKAIGDQLRVTGPAGVTRVYKIPEGYTNEPPPARGKIWFLNLRTNNTRFTSSRPISWTAAFANGWVWQMSSKFDVGDLVAFGFGGEFLRGLIRGINAHNDTANISGTDSHIGYSIPIRALALVSKAVR